MAKEKLLCPCLVYTGSIGSWSLAGISRNERTKLKSIPYIQHFGLGKTFAQHRIEIEN